MQGQLRGKPITFSIQTECAHTGRPFHIEIDSDLNYTVLEAEVEPLIFVPMVDFDRLEAPSIIDDF